MTTRALRDSRETSPGLTPRSAGTITAIAAVCAVALLAGGGGLQTSLGRTIDFRLRELLGRAPGLAPSVRIYAYDDEAATTRGGIEPTPGDWADIIAAVGERSPRAILLDRAFVHPVARAVGDTFADKLARLSAPLTGRAVASTTPLSHLGEASLARFAYGFPQLSADASSTHRWQSRARRSPAWLKTPLMYAYGPGERMAEAFRHLGHGVAATNGAIKPFVFLAETALMPHWALFAGGEPRLDNGQLTISGRNVDVDEDGTVPANLVPVENYDSRILSLAAFFRGQAAAQTAAAATQPGDTVVILTDFRQAQKPFETTALGRIPAAHIDLALVNSAISGRWLSVYQGRGLFSLTFCLLAGFLAWRLDRRRLLAAIGLGAAFLAAMGTIAFSFADTMLPWWPSLVTYVATGLTCALASARKDHTRLALLRHDLDGRIAPEKLQAILARDSIGSLDASEQVVTMMFIDIVGFSRAADRQTPKEAFSSLKSLIDQMRTAVYEHGGVVDRTMGDGMLCVFGFDVGGNDDTPQATRATLAAVQATECAARIQQDNLRRMIRAQKTHEAVFPLRIGVNTAGVYVGNLGDSDKVDLTVIGSGVNFAQRLEAACDRHMVMVGAATRDLVQHVEALGKGLRKRYIRVKHSTELVEAHELDPFHDQVQLMLDGDEAYRHLAGIERGDMRWPIPDASVFRVVTTFGPAELVNFSLDGFTIRLGDYYAKDVAFSMRMDTADRELSSRLERAGLDAVMLEVRWARPDGDTFVHGCQTKNLSREQREEVLAMLRDIVQRQAVQLRGKATRIVA